MRPADHSHRLRPQSLHRRSHHSGSRIQCCVPGDGRKIADLVSHERFGQSVGMAARLEAEAVAVAQPAPIHRVGVHPLIAQNLVARRLHHDAVAHRIGESRVRLGQIPRTGLEPIRRSSERADRAYLHGVAAEIRAERRIGEGVDLSGAASVHELYERVACHFRGEAGATVAEDAAFPVQIHLRADGDGLGEVSFRLHEAALARAESHRLILKRTLPALVADRAVQRVIHEQKFQHAFLSFLRGRAFRLHRHPFAHFHHARRLQSRPPSGVNFHQAHATHPHRAHPRVIAKSGNIDSRLLARVNEQLPFVGSNFSPVDRDRNRCLRLH